jgi:RNA polymerase sigma factor, sigma-70 family
MRKGTDVENYILLNLYKTYQNEIYLYLYTLCRNKDLAEDLMQETFMKALLSLTDKHTNMRAWLYMVARNLYFNYRKKESRNIPLDNIDDSFEASSFDIQERVIADERKRLLFKALQYLSDLKREILTMQYYGDLSQKEIAALLKLTPENVRVLAYRGKKELRLYLEENGYDIS